MIRPVVRTIVRPVVRSIQGFEIQRPSIIFDGNTVADYDYRIIGAKGVVKDGSNSMSRWNDFLESGHDLVQALGSKQMLWTSNGVIADGLDDMMKTAAFTLVQPEMIYIVLKQLSFTNFDYIIDGNANSSGFLRQGATTPNLEAYAGLVSPANNNLPLNTLGIIRILFNGGSSTFQINDGSKFTGDLGAIDMGGITLGSRADGAQPSNILVTNKIVRKSADSVSDQLIIYNYLKKKNGI